jgi:hypothetical protein
MKQFWKKLTQLALTLHIYLSMTGFLLILLFGITGLTLNHADWDWRTRTSETSSIMLPADLIQQPDEKKVTEELRRLLGVRSPVTLYRESPEEIEVLFAAPGSRTQVLIQREDGSAAVDSESRGFLGKIEDLHKGHDSGRVWSWTIDITAILLTISAMTGIVTLASLPGRRRMGFVFGALGLAICFVIYWLWVPA